MRQGLVPDDFPVPGQEFVHMGLASSGMREARMHPVSTAGREARSGGSGGLGETAVR